MKYTHIYMYIHTYVFKSCARLLTVVCTQLSRCVVESVHYKREDAAAGN